MPAYLTSYGPHIRNSRTRLHWRNRRDLKFDVLKISNFGPRTVVRFAHPARLVQAILPGYFPMASDLRTIQSVIRQWLRR
jgi:hypothetical protein